MSITVAMIEEKEFKTKMRGYDPVEVDEFLDEICDEMVVMQDEITALTQRLNQSSRNTYVSSAVPAPVPPPASIPTPAPAPLAAEAVKTREETGEAAQRLLAQAQKVYDETIAEAKAKAEEILNGANNRASLGLDDLENEKNDLQQEVEMLRQTAKDYRERFLRLIEEQQHILKSETALFE
ncbi:MAG: DivIVA domain-containing protein [Clostridia bacterium]|nr:DivIVA domain-containing protein [Clostridia bacterium]